jgi:hypothetical protein
MYNITKVAIIHITFRTCRPIQHNDSFESDIYIYIYIFIKGSLHFKWRPSIHMLLFTFSRDHHVLNERLIEKGGKKILPRY